MTVWDKKKLSQHWKSSKFNKQEYEDDKKLIDFYFKEKGFIDGRYISDTLIYDNSTKKVKI